MEDFMRVYTTQTVEGTVQHLALNASTAAQAHLHHYNLAGLQKAPKVINMKDLIDTQRSDICWNTTCCLIAAIE